MGAARSTLSRGFLLAPANVAAMPLAAPFSSSDFPSSVRTGLYPGKSGRLTNRRTASFVTTSAGLGYPRGAPCLGTTSSRAPETRERGCAHHSRHPTQETTPLDPPRAPARSACKHLLRRNEAKYFADPQARRVTSTTHCVRRVSHDHTPIVGVASRGACTDRRHWDQEFVLLESEEGSLAQRNSPGSRLRPNVVFRCLDYTFSCESYDLVFVVFY